MEHQLLVVVEGGLTFVSLSVSTETKDAYISGN